MPTFQWPVGKIDLINSALSQTGDNLVAVADDGSRMWNCCSPAYERHMAILIEEEAWGFTTKVSVLNAATNVPTDVAWDTAYVLPQDLVHIVWIKSALNSPQFPQSLLYDILDNQLVTNAQGGPPPPSPPVTPAPVTMKYVSSDKAQLENSTPLFVAAMQCYVMSAIYRGLHGDKAEAKAMWQAGELYAQKSRTRYDMQKPKRQLWNSRLLASRRVRRPWPPHGNNGWGGGGSLGG